MHLLRNCLQQLHLLPCRVLQTFIQRTDAACHRGFTYASLMQGILGFAEINILERKHTMLYSQRWLLQSVPRNTAAAPFLAWPYGIRPPAVCIVLPVHASSASQLPHFAGVLLAHEHLRRPVLIMMSLVCSILTLHMIPLQVAYDAACFFSVSCSLPFKAASSVSALAFADWIFLILPCISRALASACCCCAA